MVKIRRNAINMPPAQGLRVSAKVISNNQKAKTYIIIDETGSVSPLTGSERYFAYVATITEDYEGLSELARWNRERFNEPNEKKARETSVWGRLTFIERLKNHTFSSKAEYVDKTEPPAMWKLEPEGGKIPKKHEMTKKRKKIRLELLSHLLDYSLNGVSGDVEVIVDEHNDLSKTEVSRLCQSKSNTQRNVRGSTYPSQYTKDCIVRMRNDRDTFKHIDILQTQDYVTYAVKRYIEDKPYEAQLIGTEITQLKGDI